MFCVSQFSRSLVLAACCAAAGSAGIAATCDQTTTVSVPWTIQVTPEETTVTAAGFVDTNPVVGSTTANNSYAVNLLHTAPSVICGGPTPDLPTSVDLSALIEWGGVYGALSTANSATGSLDLTIAGQTVGLADQTVSATDRFFVDVSNFDFTVNVDSVFDVLGTLEISGVDKDFFFQTALTVLGFRVTISPYETTGFVEYLVPVPLPTTALLGLSALTLLGATSLVRRRSAR